MRAAAAISSATRCVCPGCGARNGSLDETAWALLDLLDLRAVAHDLPEGLPLGTRKRVELARALAARPKLLLLDEPAGGLNHEEVAELGALIRRLRDEQQVTVLLVEHHMNLVMSVSDKVVALDFGRKIAEGHAGRGAAGRGGDPRLSRQSQRRRRLTGWTP